MGFEEKGMREKNCLYFFVVMVGPAENLEESWWWWLLLMIRNKITQTE
jgi:hypothetical protein